MTTIRDAIATRIMPEDRVPKDLDSYPFATDAWQVHDMLRQRRVAGRHPDEFTPHEYEGVPGHQWDKPLIEALRLRYGPAGERAHFRRQVSDWLTSTGNAANIGGQGVGAVWWFRDDWNDVHPATWHRADGTPGVPVRKPPEPPAGGYKCRFCDSPFPNSNGQGKHEQAVHPIQYRENARY